MSKLYFVMNNRENTSEGYKEVSEEEFRNYIESFPKGERAYFINLGYALMETDEAGYKSFYKEYRRERYIEEEAHRAGQVSLNALDTDELDGTSIVEDESEPVEESVTTESDTDVIYKKREEESIKRIIWYNNVIKRFACSAAK